VLKEACNVRIPCGCVPDGEGGRGREKMLSNTLPNPLQAFSMKCFRLRALRD
jgi:hypothetical protein